MMPSCSANGILKDIASLSSFQSDPEVARIYSNLATSFLKTAVAAPPPSSPPTPPSSRPITDFTNTKEKFENIEIFVKVASDTYLQVLVETWRQISNKYRPPLPDVDEEESKGIVGKIEDHLSEAIRFRGEREILSYPPQKVREMMKDLAIGSAYLLAAAILQSGEAKINEGEQYFEHWIAFKQEAASNIEKMTLKRGGLNIFSIIRKSIENSISQNTGKDIQDVYRAVNVQWHTAFYSGIKENIVPAFNYELRKLSNYKYYLDFLSANSQNLQIVFKKGGAFDQLYFDTQKKYQDQGCEAIMANCKKFPNILRKYAIGEGLLTDTSIEEGLLGDKVPSPEPDRNIDPRENILSDDWEKEKQIETTDTTETENFPTEEEKRVVEAGCIAMQDFLINFNPVNDRLAIVVVRFAAQDIIDNAVEKMSEDAKIRTQKVSREPATTKYTGAVREIIARTMSWGNNKFSKLFMAGMILTILSSEY